MRKKNAARLAALLMLIPVLLLGACTGAADPGDPAQPTGQPVPQLTAEPGATAARPESGDAPAQPRVVDAGTVEELLRAIGPDTVINLTGRSYNLSEALGYGNFGSDWYGWEKTYDGYELVIEKLSNLTIRAERAGAEILTTPRYADVLRFIECSDITLEGFTAGHADGPGECTGAVLRFENSRGLRIENCELYGCGTYGVELEQCRELECVDSIIRDCSYGAVNATGSANLLFDGCTVYGIDGFGGAFWMSGCRNAALINSLIRNCKGASLLELQFTQNFYLAGCEVTGNAFEGMFASTVYPAVMEGCVFRGNSLAAGWYYETWSESMRMVDPAGEPYSDEQFAAMTLAQDVSWSPPEEDEPTAKAPEVSADGMVHVHNVDELLAAIADDTTIYLEDGVYSLNEAVGYGSYSGEHYYWMQCYDGPGLVIRNVSNLTITGGGPHRVRIAAVPRFAEVLSFENSKNLTLKNFTAGHTQAVSSCAGGVLSFINDEQVRIEDCSLYGCGILGVTGLNSRDMEIRYTEIYDCSDGAFFFNGCEDIAVANCNIHDIPTFSYQIYNCRNITADGRELPEGGSY